MSKWISVEDKLPSDDNDVLVCINNPNLGGLKPWLTTAAFCDSVWLGVSDCNVSYWMPLPKLPKDI